MSCIISAHELGGKLAGTGVIVAEDLVLTCAHVVNIALRRRGEEQARPAGDQEIEIRFAGAPKTKLRATIDAGPDAWSGPPASRAKGADLCLLQLRGILPEGTSVGRLIPVPFEAEFNVRASGYPADWNNRASEPQLDIAMAKVLGADGYLWLLRADQGAWTAAIATGKRSAGLVYSGFSGGPLQAGDAVVGLVVEARTDVRQATAYAIPAYHFPSRILPRSQVGTLSSIWVARPDSSAGEGLGGDNAQQIGRMPTVGTLLIGRDHELQLLDRAWEDTNTGVVSFIAFGGVGKSTLAVNWWLRRRAQLSGVRYHEFSFYDQGATSGTQQDAGSFLRKALTEWFGVDLPTKRWQQGELLAKCVREAGTVLNLDGLEPLQYANRDSPRFGLFYDEGMATFLLGLTSPGNKGLCICTSRIGLKSLYNRLDQGYVQTPLDNLTPTSGAQLLIALKIVGTDRELEDASKQYGNHALSLTLAAKYLAKYKERDVKQLDTIPVLSSMKVVDESRHARRILSHYEKTVFPAHTAEHAILRCIGLFDRPVQPEAMNTLRRAPPIQDLTAPLIDLCDDAFRAALWRLNELALITFNDIRGSLDCHAIIRTHFGEAVKSSELAWREGNRRLYKHYAAAAKDELPKSAEDMDVLYPAVVHACKADAFSEAWDIYWRRIQQGHPRYFNTNVLGKFHEGLGSLASFYSRPWTTVAPGATNVLARDHYLRLLTEVGFHLKVLGRFDEAKAVIYETMKEYDADNNLTDAAVNSENLAEVDLLNGEPKKALVTLQFGREGAPYAELCPDIFRRMQTLALRGQIFLCMARIDEAEKALVEAERLRVEYGPNRQPIRSLYILDLLAEVGRYDELHMIADRFRPLLSEAVAMPFTGAFNLFVGQAHALRAIREGSMSDGALGLELLDVAIKLIDASNLPHLQPRGSCIRARLLTHLREFDRARQDLHTALTISEYARLKLFEADCHLGFCELNLALGEFSAARKSLERARPAIENGGYARPRAWMDVMDGQLRDKAQ
jgi:tetratricopeptide (TPR) repeat protein